MKRFVFIALSVLVSGVASGTDDAIPLLKSLEGFRAERYSCSAGKTTIGYGFTSADIVSRRSITKQESELELEIACSRIRRKLRAEVGLRWRFVTDAEGRKVESRGLVRRREREAAVFLGVRETSEKKVEKS